MFLKEHDSFVNYEYAKISLALMRRKEPRVVLYIVYSGEIVLQCHTIHKLGNFERYTV